MNHLKWAGWGVVLVEGLDKQQRRNYLKKVREELAAISWTLHPGGSTQTPHYTVTDRNGEKHVTAGPGAFAKACAFVLEKMGEKPDVGGEDGGLRGAGAEAQAAQH